MASKTDYLENAVLNHVLRNVALTSPTTVYVALYTAAPGESAAGTEVSTSGTAYARQAITFAAPSSGSVTQSGDILFPVATSNWGTIVAYAICDAVSAGNILYYSTVTPNKAINTGDQAKIASGSIVVSED